MLTKKVLKYLDKKMDKLPLDKKSSYVKAMVIGGVEGFVDAAVLIGGASIVKSVVEVTKEVVKK